MPEGNSSRVSSPAVISRPSVIAALAIYFLVGLGLGWLWRAGSTDRDAAHAYSVWYFNEYQKEARNFWLGVPVWKSPLDLWIYEELIYRTRPDVLVEAGTYKGGSALFFASIFDLIGNGQVVTIDIYAYPNRPQNGRITYLLGSSTSNDVIEKVKSIIRPGNRVMVVLDSDHHKEHVLNELKSYSPLITPGCYLVVEDTNLSSHPIVHGPWPGPMEAVEEFLKSNHDFIQDRSCEKFGATMCPGGWLRRIH
jgi:cephalosporin hydroxylase